MPTRHTRRALAVALVAVATLPLEAQRTFSSLTMFGDSFSDVDQDDLRPGSYTDAQALPPVKAPSSFSAGMFESAKYTTVSSSIISVSRKLVALPCRSRKST